MKNLMNNKNDMIIFLHNARCGKSREALKLMEASKKNYTLREYLKNPLDYGELVELKEKLGLNAIEFTRTKETEFKQAGLTKDSTDDQILKAMVIYPKLMERAIVFDEKKAVLCRPPENILDFLR